MRCRFAISQRVVNGAASSEARYFIGRAAGTAEDYLRWVRGHWGIEDALHWVLDVCFREADQRHWAGNSAQNLAWLRKLARCLLKAEKGSKGKSIATRRLTAGWKNDYLLSVLAQIPGKSGAYALGGGRPPRMVAAPRERGAPRHRDAARGPTPAGPRLATRMPVGHHHSSH